MPAFFLKLGAFAMYLVLAVHNRAYLGGALAIPVAWVFHLVYRRRCRAGQSPG